jgi:hypothetical protein
MIAESLHLRRRFIRTEIKPRTTINFNLVIKDDQKVVSNHLAEVFVLRFKNGKMRTADCRLKGSQGKNKTIKKCN